MNNPVNLPPHIAFVQNLPCAITDTLSNSCAQALSVNDLCQLVGAKLSNIANVSLAYAPLKGGEQLRAQIAHFHHGLNRHQSELTAEHVLTFCGAQEALACSYQLLLRPGDEVVVVTPNYPSLTQMAEKMAAKITPIPLTKARQWRLTLADFERVINPQTRLIVINSPHNPSGQVIDAALADGILRLAQQYDCYLLVDDVSQASNYHHLDLSHRYLDYDKTILVSVMSKSFGLAGLRVGWALSRNKDLLADLLALKSYGSICGSSVDEALATLALTHHQTIIHRNNDIIKHNIEQVQNLIDKFPDKLAWTPPKAGLLAVLEVKGEPSIEHWAQRLAASTGMLALPLTLFGVDGSYFRLGLGQENLPLLLNRLANFLSD